jgi:hypothetical protein
LTGPLSALYLGRHEPPADAGGAAECPKIRGLVCFFQEREATLFVDGEQCRI